MLSETMFLRSMKMLKAHLKTGAGFTLVEVLLVLFSVTIVLSVTFPIFIGRLDYSMYEQALQKFYITMYEAQYIAKERGRRTSITIEEGNLVTITVDKAGVISQWKLPEDMKFNMKKLNHAIVYTEAGTISRLGSIVIETPYWQREYTINLTYGRMREQ